MSLAVWARSPGAETAQVCHCNYRRNASKRRLLPTAVAVRVTSGVMDSGEKRAPVMPRRVVGKVFTDEIQRVLKLLLHLVFVLRCDGRLYHMSPVVPAMDCGSSGDRREYMRCACVGWRLLCLHGVCTFHACAPLCLPRRIVPTISRIKLEKFGAQLQFLCMGWRGRMCQNPASLQRPNMRRLISSPRNQAEIFAVRNKIGVSVLGVHYQPGAIRRTISGSSSGTCQGRQAPPCTCPVLLPPASCMAPGGGQGW